MKPIVSVIGTRPDALKLLPVHRELAAQGFNSLVCATFQHDELLQQVLELFQEKPSCSLNIMKKNQDLFHITTSALEGVKKLIDEVNPQLILVQGDTTSSFAAALAGFYRNIPVGHVEAGLRTGDVSSPYPEEANRRFIGTIARYHFAPTYLNVANLLREGIDRESIFLTGNTIVDALNWLTEQLENEALPIDQELKEKIVAAKAAGKKIVLLTVHRRESFAVGLREIFEALKQFLARHPDVLVVYPAHPNPNVTHNIAQTNLANHPQIILTVPLEYPSLLYCLQQSAWVATDSGGIQEEAMSLGKPVMILREKTERIEGVWAGLARLSGTSYQRVLSDFEHLYTNHEMRARSAIYGDGTACKQIVSILKERLLRSETLQSQDHDLCSPHLVQTSASVSA